MKTIMLNATVGEEVTLKNGNATLVVKVDADKIVPDFVESVTEVVKNDPRALTFACSGLYQKNMNGEKYLRQVLAQKRDDLFMSIKPEAASAEPAVTIKPEATSEGTE